MEVPTIKLYHRVTGEMFIWNCCDIGEAMAAGFFANKPEPKQEEKPDEKKKPKEKK